MPVSSSYWRWCHREEQEFKKKLMATALLPFSDSGSAEVRIVGTRRIQPLDIYLLIFGDDIDQWKDKESDLASSQPRVRLSMGIAGPPLGGGGGGGGGCTAAYG